jgi:hypothetical protein
MRSARLYRKKAMIENTLTGKIMPYFNKQGKKRPSQTRLSTINSKNILKNQAGFNERIDKLG